MVRPLLQYQVDGKLFWLGIFGHRMAEHLKASLKARGHIITRPLFQKLELSGWWGGSLEPRSSPGKFSGDDGRQQDGKERNYILQLWPCVWLGPGSAPSPKRPQCLVCKRWGLGHRFYSGLLSRNGRGYLRSKNEQKRNKQTKTKQMLEAQRHTYR